MVCVHSSTEVEQAFRGRPPELVRFQVQIRDFPSLGRLFDLVRPIRGNVRGDMRVPTGQFPAVVQFVIPREHLSDFFNSANDWVVDVDERAILV